MGWLYTRLFQLFCTDLSTDFVGKVKALKKRLPMLAACVQASYSIGMELVC